MVNKLRVLAVDIDGVLTDGTASVGDGSLEAKRFNYQDLDAIGEARRAGFEIVALTAETGATVKWIAKRFGIERVVEGVKDKQAAIEELARVSHIPLESICYVGDGDRDAPALAAVGLGIAPANATPAALSAAHRVLRRSGGHGALAEAVRLLTTLVRESALVASLAPAIGEILAASVEAHKRLRESNLTILAEVAIVLVQAVRCGRKILLFGNGGSAADAQHVAAELVGRFSIDSDPWPAIALTTNTSILTAVGNDWTYEEVFSRQVRALARPGDIAVGISTSGSSPNVLRALQAANDQGALTVGFTGVHGQDMEELCDYCFLAPDDRTPRIQELHLAAWHAICELVERELMSAPTES